VGRGFLNIYRKALKNQQAVFDPHSRTSRRKSQPPVAKYSHA
jgi:hypothetical protein